jgi:S-(hydroxymethyl)glutathione dehydrogenase/alcohol dehydrogenase
MRPRFATAAVLVGQNKPLEIMKVEIPRLDIGQVLIEVKASGVCGKQLDEISGKQGPDPYLPHMLGHEGSGIVIETGPKIKKSQARRSCRSSIG